MNCCEHHQINCRQGRDCPSRLITKNGGETVGLPTPEEAMGWPFKLLVGAAVVLALAVVFLPVAFRAL